MNKVLHSVAITVLALAFLQSCSYQKKELTAPAATCSDTMNVSYATKVRPLLQAKCFTCHGNGASNGDISLETYDQVKQVASTGRLLGTISHAAGFSPMPLGAAKLDECSIEAVKTWIEEGAQDN